MAAKKTPQNIDQAIDEAIQEGFTRAQSLNKPKREAGNTRFTKDETLPYFLQGLETLEKMPLSKLTAKIDFKGKYTVISTNIPNTDNTSNLNIMVMERGKYKTYFHDKEGAHATMEYGDWDKTLSYIAEQAAIKGTIAIKKTMLSHAEKTPRKPCRTWITMLSLVRMTTAI